MMGVFISMNAAAAAFMLIIDFRSKTSGRLFDTFETAPCYWSNKFRYQRI